MKNIILLLAISTSVNLFSQTITEVDSVATSLCNHLEKLTSKNDTLKLKELYNTQLFPYLASVDQANAQQTATKIYYRLQRNCPGFRVLLDRLEPPRDGVKRNISKPTSEISKKELKKFRKKTDLYYCELNGDTTTVSMNNGIWRDSFSDGTFSKLNYKWINEFELIFIESNNDSRANFSVKGDRYLYQLLSKKENHYLLSINIPGQKRYDVIKIYYK